MMRIDANAALALAAFIRNDLGAIARIESHVSQFDLNNLSPAELDSLGYRCITFTTPSRTASRKSL